MWKACFLVVSCCLFLDQGRETAVKKDYWTGQSSPFRRLPEGLTPGFTREERMRLATLPTAESFWELIGFYSGQDLPSTCSVASAMNVLNGLRVMDSSGTREPLLNPKAFFSPAVCRVVSREKVEASGMTLRQFADALRTFPVNVDMVYSSDTTLDEFRNILSEALRNSKDYVVVNYSREVLDQGKSGHLSPIGAYDKERDLVLIMDTHNAIWPMTWVPCTKLWEAMSKGVDDESSRTRGYVRVTPQKN